MHIGYEKSKETPKTVVNCEETILGFLRENPKITLAEVAEKISKSLRTVKTLIKNLQDNGVVERVGGKKKWQLES